ncbi:uncharacterized protein LOC131326435 [Rhododendron vialii]|uniref:uncharacterized protein LOC131326435 n=1 Tax=Rhododendron vialii TaxID=182163 RepID=UPI00265F0661|nr:uncharacterized protein LOC131326435 [Rhododendron vialii]
MVIPETNYANFYVPEDCWELIFNRLEEDVLNLAAVSLVSKRFLSSTNRLKVSLKSTDEMISLLPGILRRFQHLKNVEINTESHEDMSGLIHLISQYGLNVESLKQRFNAIIDCFPGLEEATISGYVTDDGLSHLHEETHSLSIEEDSSKLLSCIAKARPPLKKLKLYDNWCRGLSSLLQSCWSTLEELTLANRRLTKRRMSKVSNIFGRYSERSGMKLKILKACGTKLNDEAMAMIGNRCPDLQFLNIGYCEEVTSDGVKEVVRKCKRLRVLNVRGCPNVGIGILDWMVISRPSIALKEFFSPCGFPPPSEDMRNLRNF